MFSSKCDESLLAFINPSQSTPSAAGNIRLDLETVGRVAARLPGNTIAEVEEVLSRWG